MTPPDLSFGPLLRILFVCSGNTCRSPMAEVLARKLASDSGLERVEFSSAGTSTVLGLPASEGAQKTARSHGLSLDDHRSTPLSPELVERADRIFAMGPTHLHRVREMGGEGKSALLGAFARPEQGPENHLAVPDPFGETEEVYEETFQTLEIYVGLALGRLAEEEEG